MLPVLIFYHMKYFVIVCLTFLAAFTASAQKDFEGVIKYRIITPSSEGEKEKADSMMITVFFAPRKILMKTNIGDDKGEENDILVLLDSAKVFTIDTKEKTYRVKKLKESVPFTSVGKETIAGYSGTPVQYEGNKLINMLRGNTTLWFADDLIFSIPRKYEMNEEFIMINKSHILLKAIISMDMGFGYGMDEENETTEPKNSEMTLHAIEIIASQQSPSVFTIPAEYMKEDRRTFVPPLLFDTTMILVDSVTTIKDTMPPPPLKPAPTKKAPVKQPIKTTPAKKPIRKEN